MTQNQSPNLLTLGIATYQEFDNGLWALLQTMREFHPSEVDILVIDNAPTPCQRTLSVTIASGGTYYHRPDLVGTSAPRDALFRLARTPWVLCVDAHIILCRDSVKYLLLHLEDHLHSRDLLQGPMVYDDGKGYSTHWKQDAPPGLWGTWDADTEKVARHLPFEIPMMGLGLFAMRRDAWPGFNPLFHGFGGEEGYLHQKVRRQGGKCLCLPWLRWKHKFRHTEHGAPPPPYPTRLEDHVWNLLIGHRELGIGAIPQIREVFGLRLPDGVFEQMLRQVEQVQEWNKIRERKRLRLLGVWYTNNKAPLPLLQKSLGTIWNAQTQTMHHDVDVVTSAWNHVEGNPFVSMLGKPAEEGHAAIIRQVHRCLHDSGFNTNRGHDALLFLEHDVLYPACYFDRMGDLLATGAPVASNLDYLGLNQTGWLRVKERHEPLHQLGLRRDVALANLKRAQRDCEKQGWAYLEPDHGDEEARKKWARFLPNGLMPSVHVNW